MNQMAANLTSCCKCEKNIVHLKFALDSFSYTNGTCTSIQLLILLLLLLLLLLTYLLIQQQVIIIIMYLFDKRLTDPNPDITVSDH